MNEHKRRAQRAKADALVSAFDAICDRSRFELGRIVTASERLATLAGYDEPKWAALALGARKRPPSAETVALVLGEYEARLQRVAS